MNSLACSGKARPNSSAAAMRPVKMREDAIETIFVSLMSDFAADCAEFIANLVGALAAEGRPLIFSQLPPGTQSADTYPPLLGRGGTNRSLGAAPTTVAPAFERTTGHVGRRHKLDQRLRGIALLRHRQHGD